MLRISTWLLLVSISLFASFGCGGQNPGGDARALARIEEKIEREERKAEAELPPEPKLSPEERYSLAVADAFRLMAEMKHEDALVKLRAALEAQKTDFVVAEIERLERDLKQKSIAEKTAADIRAILQAGKPEEASRLASDALLQFGDSEIAVVLTQIKKEADAILSAELGEGNKKQRFRQEALQALEAKNIRAALISYDQAVANGENDPELKAKFEGYRNALQQYEETRSQAIELRKDSGKVDLALATFQKAKEIWPTSQVQQDIQETELVIANRRPRVAIGHFEVIGDVGIPNVGQAIAEEILPHFRGKYDIVEHSQVREVVEQLKLGDTNWANDQKTFGQVGQIVKANYMVVGSVSKIFGISVNARLVDVNSGLVVQTAKVVAGTPEELVKKLPSLARILQMNDQEKVAFEMEIAKAETIQPAPVSAAIAAPPPAATTENITINAAPGSTVIINSARPPEYGGITAAEFAQVAQAPPSGTVVIVEAPMNVRQRSLFVALEIGDDLYRRRRFAEALRYYEFALTLAPDMPDIRVRIDNCRPFLGFGNVVVVVNALPRLAVLPFAEFGNPYVIPPGTGVWTADNLAYQFSGMYEIVDRGELFWWMGRLGLSVRDVMMNPSARLCLARAMNTRFFLMGSIQGSPEVPGMDVTTNLIDVETGGQIGSALMHVRDSFELKCRMRELAQVTVMPPAQRVVYVQQQVVVQQRMATAEINIRSGKFSLAIGFYEEELVRQPNNTQILIQLDFARRRNREQELEAARYHAYMEQQARIKRDEDARVKLAIKLEAEKAKAERNAAIVTAVENQKNQQYRLIAQQDLLRQARTYLQQAQYQPSLNAYQVAYNMSPNDAILQEMAVARQQADRQTQARNAQFAANQQVMAKAQQQQQIARVQPLIAQQQQTQAAAIQQQRQALMQRDQQEYQQLMAAGKQAQAAQNWKQAVASYQAAYRLNQTPESHQLASNAVNELARAEAAAKGDAQKRAFEAQLAQENARKQAAEAAAQVNKQKYEAAMQAARQAHAAKQLAQAEAQYNAALAINRTQEVEAALRQLRDEQAKANAAGEAQKKAQMEAARKQQEFDKAFATGKSASSSGKYDEAITSFKLASNLKPDDTAVKAELLKVEQAKNKARMDAVSKTNLADLEKQNAQAAEARAAQAKREANMKAAADAKAANEAKLAQQKKEMEQAEAKRLADAKAANDGKAAEMRKQAEAAQAKRDADAKSKMDMEVRQAQMKKEAEQAKLKQDENSQQAAQQAAKMKNFLTAAEQAVNAKRYDSAEGLLAEARKINPNDPGIANLEKQITAGKAAASSAQMAAQDTAKKQQAYNDAIQKGRTAYGSRDFDGAIEHFHDALKAMPNDRTATSFLAQTEQAKKEFAASNAAMAAEQEKKKNYDAAMAKGQQALQAKQYAQAKAAFQEALRYNPNDATATRAIAQADQAQQAAMAPPKVDPVTPPKIETPNTNPRVTFNQLMAQTRAAMAQRKYDDANASITQALKLFPNDPDALKLQADLKTAMAPAGQPAQPKSPTQPMNPAPATDPKAAAFAQYMQQAKTLFAANRLLEANGNVTEALKLVPTDPEATKLHQQIQAAMQQPKKDNPPAQPNPQAQIQQYVGNAQAMEQRGKFAEAGQNYDAALRLNPSDANLKKRGDFCKFMASGQRNRTGGKFADAENDFNNALKLYPTDADAKTELAKAKRKDRS
ncbi:hypothetical protein KIH39_00570 [Telmatocola sphagniphila]|uniref:Tetratricopeptide repeat protein n=1 Tax=Telmatocola sphagniphila TaxID=1123043 RepID=A0A8E6B6N2_9BACT|nr:tetratricopeptide repeat protein [Telmatocola sphagniphila]QVL32444.1 hypothetical protein KIH39_00570 [Telmatocola sphagniphila]